MLFFIQDGIEEKKKKKKKRKEKKKREEKEGKSRGELIFWPPTNSVTKVLKYLKGSPVPALEGMSKRLGMSSFTFSSLYCFGHCARIWPR